MTSRKEQIDKQIAILLKEQKELEEFASNLQELLKHFQENYSDKYFFYKEKNWIKVLYSNNYRIQDGDLICSLTFCSYKVSKDNCVDLTSYSLDKTRAPIFNNMTEINKSQFSDVINLATHGILHQLTKILNNE